MSVYLARKIQGDLDEELDGEKMWQEYRELLEKLFHGLCRKKGKVISYYK